MAHSKDPSNPKPTSPTLSTSSSSSLSSDDLGLLDHGYSPAPRAAKRRVYNVVSPSPAAPRMARTISLDDVMERKASSAGGSTGREPVVEVKGKGKAPQMVRRERQTRISEHLQAVKPASPSPSASSKSSAASTSGPTVVVHVKKPVRSLKKKVVVVVEQGPPVDEGEKPSVEELKKRASHVDVMEIPAAELKVQRDQDKEQLARKLATYGSVHSLPSVGAAS